MNMRKKTRQKRGPYPEMLKIEGNWEDAVERVLTKKKSKDNKK
jgi:hypothetical protein